MAGECRAKRETPNTNTNTYTLTHTIANESLSSFSVDIRELERDEH